MNLGVSGALVSLCTRYTMGEGMMDLEMERKIPVSERLYTALQQQATRSRKPLNLLVEGWLEQHLNLEQYRELEWRQGPGGWRVGIKDIAVDVYTVVGYSQAGYSPQEIVDDLLPALSLEQVRAALCYYADYPQEIDQILLENEAEISKARLYRTLGPEGYRQLTQSSEQPRIIREARAGYQDSEPNGESD